MKRLPLTVEQYYEEKKANCIERMIKFDMTLEEWKVLMNMQLTETCAYTNLPFDNSKNGQRVSVERVFDEKGYTTDNVCLVTTLANALKNDYVFLEGSVKKLNSTQKGYVHRIKKILSSQENIDKILAPYKEAFESLKSKNSILIKEQNRLKAEKESKEKLQDKYFQEILFAEYYNNLAKSYINEGKLLEMTIGECKKVVKNCTKDSITGEVFKKLDDKDLWVIDDSKPINKNNIKVVHSTTKKGLQLLLQSTTISQLSLSLHKIQNKREK